MSKLIYLISWKTIVSVFKSRKHMAIESYKYKPKTRLILVETMHDESNYIGSFLHFTTIYHVLVVKTI